MTVIVYRNPIEAWLWNNGAFGHVVVFCLVMSLVFVVQMIIIDRVLPQRVQHRYLTLIVWVAGIISFTCAVFAVTQFI